MYDVIGDVHGHADELESLLQHLGYEQKAGVYRHPDRQAIFLGDFVDRGPDVPRVLDIVRRMRDAGTAQSVMGNHELNLLALHVSDPACPGEYLRRRTDDNLRQVRRTLEQIPADVLPEYLDWMRTLPLWLDLPGFRVVHACWDATAINQVAHGLAQHGGVTDAFLAAACRPGQPLFEPVETLLKGKELPLPEGHSFTDREGKVRRRARVKWYLDPQGHTFATYTLHSLPMDEVALPESWPHSVAPYPQSDKPVFVGHYCLSQPVPQLLAANVACLDYCIAKNGFLAAYRWDGEPVLQAEHFAWVIP